MGWLGERLGRWMRGWLGCRERGWEEAEWKGVRADERTSEWGWMRCWEDDELGG